MEKKIGEGRRGEELGGEERQKGRYELRGKEERGKEERIEEDMEGKEENKRILEQEKEILVSGRVGMPSPIVKALKTHARY